MKHKLILLLILCSLLISIVGCAQKITIKELNSNSDEYLNKKVILQGTVAGPLNIMSINGFTLINGANILMVSSDTVPEPNTKVRIKGEVLQGLIFPNYLIAYNIKEIE